MEENTHQTFLRNRNSVPVTLAAYFIQREFEKPGFYCKLP